MTENVSGINVKLAEVGLLCKQLNNSNDHRSKKDRLTLRPTTDQASIKDIKCDETSTMFHVLHILQKLKCIRNDYFKTYNGKSFLCRSTSA